MSNVCSIALRVSCPGWRPIFAGASCRRLRQAFGANVESLSLQYHSQGTGSRSYSGTAQPSWRKTDFIPRNWFWHLGCKTKNRHLPCNIDCAAFSTQKKPKKAPKPRPTAPENYNPEEGLPFQKADLSDKEVSAIFGPTSDPVLANRVLKLLHGRRITGTLEDGISFPEVTGFSQQFVATALAWLRNNHPVDEEAAVRAREKNEYQELELELVTDAERVGIWVPQSGVKNGDVYGKGVLDSIREEALRKHHQQETSKKYEAQANEVKSNSGSLQYIERKVELSERREPKWVQYYRERAMITTDPNPPKLGKLGKWKALWPSFVTCGVVIGLCILFSENYTPPSHSGRLWPDMPRAAATVLGIILANAAILVLWRFPPAWRFLNRFFISAPAYPVALSLIGSLFSHQQIKHFLGNMVVLWFIGTRLHESVGRGEFLAIYFSSGVVGVLASTTYSILKGSMLTASCGASGAVFGVITAWCNVNSDKQFSIMFLPPESTPPLSSNMILAFLLLLEIASFRAGGWLTGAIDHLAHLGGGLAGLASSIWLKKKMKQSRSASNSISNESSTDLGKNDR